MSTPHTYTPRGACLQAFKRRDPEILVAGPAGTGKSRACLEKLHTMCLINPGMRALIVRKTAVSLSSTALVTWRRDVIPEALAAGVVTFYGGSAEEPAQYRYANGSKVVLGGLDKSIKIMSSEYDLIYVQEATELTEDDWEALTTRLRSNIVSFQQLLADCNPSTPTHWLKTRCDRGQAVMLESRHEDNPTLFDDQGVITESGSNYIAKLDALTGPRYLRLRKGVWAAAEGVIYDEWDAATHLIDPYPIPDEWRRIWAVDFGYTNPFVLQCWAVDPDGRLILYREIYRTGRLVEDHAKQILDIVAPGGVWLEPKPSHIICDHDAEGRATLDKHLGRLSTTPAIKTVLDGIQFVQARIRTGRLLIMRDAVVERDPELADASKPVCTAEEIPGYIWADTLKEQPVKEDDHGMDSMRYVVMALERAQPTRVKSAELSLPGRFR
jgi:phage terminase large subunit